MRFEITGQWDKEFEHDGLLYCAQRIEEMLMFYTSHLYKVPVYNTFLLAYEFLNTYNSVERKNIDQAHLKNVRDEFVASFKSDIVIKENLTENQIQYFTSRLIGSSIVEQVNTMHYLIHIMRDYPNWSAETLKKAVVNPKGKKNIEKALRSYIPMIIGLGYSPRFIYVECKSFFMNPTVSNIDVLESFLKKFNAVDNEYTVYFIVSKKTEKFRTILEERLNISFEIDDYSKNLKYDFRKQICVHRTESALDPNGAVQKSLEHFSLFMRYYRFLGNRGKEKIGHKCLVIDANGSVSAQHMGLERYFYSQNYDDKTLGKNSESIITHLIENAGRNDFFKIDKIIRKHNTALSSQDINSAFLNLWSVMEIVGVDGSESDVSKIKQILANVVPILKRNYVNRIVEELHDYLKCNIAKPQYEELLNSIVEEGTEEYKIACLISLEKYEESRKKAYRLLKKYPLIRSRISNLYEDVFKKKKKLLTELTRYEERISWHLQRLYRVRNAIIHSGESAENMVPLVEHLHSYVDEIIMDLINRMTTSPGLGTIANVLLDAKVFVDTFTKENNSDSDFTAEDIKRILQ